MTNYIENPVTTIKPRSKKLSTVLSMVLATLIAFVGAGTLAVATIADKADAFDVTQWVMCEILPAPAPALYQFSQSDDLLFLLRSKSSVTSGSSDVEVGLNWILDLFGPGFKAVNQEITGVDAGIVVKTPEDAEEPEEDEPKDYNKGVKVTPFDRFGVAGLNFTAYSGEWKYIVVDACSTDSEPNDPKAGVYYEERLEPRSTWDDKDNSKDIRTVQLTKGFGGQILTAMNNVVANGIFTVTKGIVVLTVGVINFAFSDVTEIIGLNDLVGSEGGMFDVLFSGIFMPLIAIVFVLTAAHIFYLGVVKRQYRNSLGMLFRSIVMFVMAVVIAAAPSFWISVPNKIAVVGQSILITALNTDMTSGDGLCSTDIGSMTVELVDESIQDEAGMLERTGQNMRAAIGCTFWDTFLMTPWVEGQFGTDWNSLWAAGETAAWAPDGSEELANGNGEQVGLAEVPLGGGAVMNNWALYHISTQTNVHVPTGHEGERSKYTSDTANDWWRIVDAISNYQEEEITEVVSGTGGNGSPQEIIYTLPKADALPTSYWNDWTGNHSWNRIGVAASSVVIAGLGTALPLFFGLMSSVYAFGIVLLMAFAPIMLLMGCWSNRGWEAFKGWGELVVNTTMKRIVTGLLLGLSITFIVKIVDMMAVIPWWQGILLLILITVLLFKVRHKIYDSLASFKFSTTGFGSTAGRLTKSFTDKASQYSRTSGRMALGTVGGGIGAKAAGGTFATGASAGFKKELQQTVFRGNSQFLHSARMTKDAFDAASPDRKDEWFNGSQFCGLCGKRIETEQDRNGTDVFHGGQMANGTIICLECFQDGVDPDANEIIHRHRQEAKDDPKLTKSQQEKAKAEKIKHKYSEIFKAKSAYSGTFYTKLVKELEAGRVINPDTNESEPLTKKTRSQKVMQLGKFVSSDISNYKKLPKGERKIPEIPPYLQPYLNDRDLRFAWEDENPQTEYIEAMYATAILQWYYENIDGEIDVTFEGLIKSMMETRTRDKDKKTG